jgi:tetratricopeptide (TPR) repeat protein
MKGIKNIGWLCSFITVVLLYAANFANAQMREIIATGEYVMGDGETMAVSEERARTNAVRKAAEEAGVYVKSYSKVRNLTLQEDEVELIANHAMKVTVADKSRSMEGNAVRLTVKIKAVVSEADIEANLRQAASDRQTITEHRRLKEEFARQTRELEDLKKQLAGASAEKQKEVLDRIGENENQFRAALFLEDGLAKLSALNFSGAETSLTKAIELNPKLAQAYAARAEARLFHADKKELLADVNRAIDLEPQSALYYAVRARINAFKSNCSGQNPPGCNEAFQDVRKARTLDGGNPAYVMMEGALYAAVNQFDRAAEQYDKAVAMLPSSALPLAAVNTYLQRADFRLDEAQGDYIARALEDLNRAVSIIRSPAYMTGDVKKVAATMKLKPRNDQEGVRLVKEIWGVNFLDMNPAEQKAFRARMDSANQVLKNVTLVYWKRSQILYEAGDVQAAEKDRAAVCEWIGDEMLTYASGIVADADICTPKGVYRPFGTPQKLQAYQWFRRGQRLSAKDRYSEAIVQLGRALELDSDLAGAYIARAFAYEHSKPPLFAEAIADFTQAIRIEPANSRILYERGLAFWARSKDKEWNGDEKGAAEDRSFAEKDFSKVIKLKNDDIHRNLAFVQRGRVYQAGGRYAPAAKDYDSAARFHGNIEMFLDKARVLEMAGTPGDAVRALDEYIAAVKKRIAETGGGDADLEQKIADARAEKKRLKQPKKSR